MGEWPEVTQGEPRVRPTVNSDGGAARGEEGLLRECAGAVVMHIL